MISQWNTDETFPEAQFYIDRYSNFYRLDRNSNSSGILLYLREDILSKKMKKDLQNTFEGCFIKINLIKKWLLGCPYNPH